jgi:hypothetical protein
MNLHPDKFRIAFGIVYALVFFIYGLAAALFGWGGAMAEMIGSFYVGFGPTLSGALIGAVWGFAVGSCSSRWPPGFTTGWWASAGTAEARAPACGIVRPVP